MPVLVVSARADAASELLPSRHHPEANKMAAEDEGYRVQLYIYDLSRGLAALYSRALLSPDAPPGSAPPVRGIWHTSVVVHGSEFFYGQGISAVSPPGTTHHGTPVDVLDMGKTFIDAETLSDYVAGMRHEYTAERYHLLEFNCNTFSADLLAFLNGTEVPDEIRHLPERFLSTPLGQQLAPMINSFFPSGASNGSRAHSASSSRPMPPEASQIVHDLAKAATESQSQAPAGSATANGKQRAEAQASSIEMCTNTASLEHAVARARGAVAILYRATHSTDTSSASNGGAVDALERAFEHAAHSHQSLAPPLRASTISYIIYSPVEAANNEAVASALGDVKLAADAVTFAWRESAKQVSEVLRAASSPSEIETSIKRLIAIASAHSAPIAPFSAVPNLDALSKKLVDLAAPHGDEAIQHAKKLGQLAAYLSKGPGSSPAFSISGTGVVGSSIRLAGTLKPEELFPVLDLWRLYLARHRAGQVSAPSQISTADAQSLVGLLERPARATLADRDAASGDKMRPTLLTALRLAVNLSLHLPKDADRLGLSQHTLSLTQSALSPARMASTSNANVANSAATALDIVARSCIEQRNAIDAETVKLAETALEVLTRGSDPTSRSPESSTRTPCSPLLVRSPFVPAAQHLCRSLMLSVALHDKAASLTKGRQDALARSRAAMDKDAVALLDVALELADRQQA